MNFMTLNRYFPLMSPEDGAAAGGAAGSGAAAAGGEGGAAGGTGGAAAGGEGGNKFAWGDGWRDQLAKGDEKVMSRLQRFNTPEDIFTSYRALEQRLSSGELKSALPKDAKPEDVAKWRAENGVPETPDKYDLKFDNGIVVGDEDKPVIDGFLKFAHERNLSNDVVKANLEWYYNEVERQTEARHALDEQIKTKSEDSLRAEWGQEYRGNMNRVDALLASMPANIRDVFMHGRLSDGTPIGASADVLKTLSLWARQINPTATVVPGDGANIGSAIADEITQIEKTMRTDRKAYNKDEKMQARYRELLSARERLAGNQQQAAGMSR